MCIKINLQVCFDCLRNENMRLQTLLYDRQNDVNIHGKTAGCQIRLNSHGLPLHGAFRNTENMNVNLCCLV